MSAAKGFFRNTRVVDVVIGLGMVSLGYGLVTETPIGDRIRSFFDNTELERKIAELEDALERSENSMKETLRATEEQDCLSERMLKALEETKGN